MVGFNDGEAQGVDSVSGDVVGLRQGVPFSEEEIAQVLTEQEGRPVSVQEVRMVCMQALRKLRTALHNRGYCRDDWV